jgi:hypothetical protein
VKAVAARLGTTEGRVATIAIGLVFGLVTAAWGIPPVVRDRTPAPAVVSRPVVRTTLPNAPAPRGSWGRAAWGR